MKKKLFYKDKQPIGIDISQTGIKVMAIDTKQWLIQGYGSIDLDPAKMQDALDMSDPDDTFLGDSLRSLLKEHIVGDLPSNHAVIGIPSARAFSRTFILPITELSTLADAVEVEVSQYIPIPMNALYVDYEVIERTKETATVIMSAVPRTVIDASIKAVHDAGLRPVMVEPSAHAVARILEKTEDGKLLPTVIVDIGQAQTDIAILDRGVIRVSGNLPVGGNTFTLDIANKLGIPLDNAHQLKVINGLSPSPKQRALTEALGPSLRRIVTETQKVMRYYTERVDENAKLEQVLVVGAGSNVPGIGEFFTDATVMPARVASAWQRFDFGHLPQPNKQFRPRYITVAGLASVPYEEIWK
ncbi:MAG TPA: type IV pilus assembly protein PilM [Patescibacteria group bacterium]|nr:type IV pilus assembly protein PilM [Patescibacteria group bacterium]